MYSRQPRPVDKIIGRNVRFYRLARRLSQKDLAERLGMSYQQVQKYEKGASRIGSGSLLEISGILGVSLLALFEGSGTELPGNTTTNNKLSPPNLLMNPLSLRLLQAFSEISERRTQQRMVEFVESIVRPRAKQASRDGARKSS